ncbi:fibronectin type III domain-containing protein [Brumimicrobium glaciale]|nr:fibronectin type III domain-containing protein [Brumimicrobium glaciale]
MKSFILSIFSILILTIGNTQVLTEGFESGIPVNWSQEYESGSADWVQAAQNSNNTIAPRTGTGMAHFQTNNYTSVTKLVTPELDLTSLTVPELSFYFANVSWGSDITELRMYYKNTAGGAWTQFGLSYTTAHTSWTQVEIILPNPSSTYYIAFEGSSNYARGLELDDIIVIEAPSCIAPTALTTTNITATSADLGWTDNNSATAWNVEYGAAGFGQGGGTMVTGTTTNPHSLSGLSGNTAYDFYVKSDCGGGDESAWSGPFSFTTSCSAASVPYTQDFESVTIPGLPSCTSLENTGIGNDWRTGNPTGFTGQVLNYSYHGSSPAGTANSWFYTQGIDLDAGVAYSISYKYGNNSTTWTESLKVAFGASPVELSMTNSLADYPAINTSTPIDANITFTVATDGVYYFGFNCYSIENQNQLYVDDILVDVVPTCLAPSTLTAANITASSAELGWTDNASATTWNVEYGADGFAQVGGTTITGTTTNPYSLSGLSASTDYDYYVQTDCGGGDLSTWEGPFSFTTPCAIEVPDYTEDFTTFLNPCWSKAKGPISGPTSFGSSQWVSDNFGNTGSNNSARFNLYNTGGQEWLITPMFDLTGGGFEINLDAALTPWSGTASSIIEADDAVYVMQSIDGGATWTTIYTWDAANSPSNIGDNITIDISAIISATTQFAIFALEGNTSGGDYRFFIDNFKVRTPPSCNAPSALTVTNLTAILADLGWTENGTATAWNVEYGADGYTQGGGTMVTATTTKPHSISGLSANTAYDFYVQADCGGAGTSTWSGPFSFTTPASCPAPSTLTATNLTATSASLGWTENGTATTWNVEYGADGFAQVGGTTITGTTTNPYSLSGLSASTDYDYYVQTDCGGGDLSTWEGPFSFTTPCGSITPDYSTDFTSFLPSCWDEASSGTLTTGPTSIGTGSWHQSVTRARINLYSNNTEDWLLTPAFDLSVGGYELVINTNATDYGSTTSFSDMGSDDEVQIVVSTDGGTTWTAIYTWDNTNPLQLAANDVSIDLSAYTGANTLFGIWAYEGTVNDTEDYYIYINNFEIRTPPSCLAPSTLTAINITSTSADLGWTESGTATTWNIEYGTSGFIATGTPSITGTTTNPHSISGLSANTAYDFYVQADCGSGTSTWSGPFSFTTPCGVLTPTYTQDFASFLPDCWEEAKGILTASTILTGTSSSWIADGFANAGSSGAARMNIYATNQNEWLISPSMDLTGGPFQLKYDVALTKFSGNTASTMDLDDSLVVVISTDNGATWSDANILKVYTSGSEPSNTGSLEILNLSAYTGTIKIGFYAYSSQNLSVDNNVYIDNFVVELVPSCSAPSTLTATNITSSSADLGWTENGTATTWNVEYGASGFIATGTPTVTGTSTNPYSVTGLSATTTYDFYVQSDCGGNQSSWTGPFSVTTPCGTYTPDYAQDFASFLPDCWEEAKGILTASTILTGTSSSWIADGFANAGSSGAARMNIYATNQNEWLISPAIDLTGGPFQLEYDVALTVYSGTGATTLDADDSLAVVISTDNGATWSNANILKTYTSGSEPSNAGEHATIDLSAYSGVVKFGFYATSTVNLSVDNDIFIDNILVTSFCASTSGTDTQAACETFDWIDGNTYTSSNNIAMHTLTNAAGCDSIVTLDLTINNSNTGTDTQIACDSYTWIDGNTYTASNNTATHTLTNAANCDSVVTLALTINNSSTGTDTQIACDSYTWIDGNTYTASNTTATHTLTNAANCDSVVTLALTINNSSSGTDTQVACDSYTWIDGMTYNSSNNTATHTLTNAANCDSVVTLALTINNSTTGTDTQVACVSLTWIDGVVYTADNNTATHTIVGGSMHGCDSVVTLNLTMNNIVTGTDTQVSCDSYTWIDGMTYTSSNNSAIHTIVGGSTQGCDSIVTLDLTINNSNTGTDTQVACDSYIWIDGNTYTASNTTATHTLTNAANCDSVVTLALTINNSNTGTDTQIACDSYTWIDGNTYTASNTTATHTLTNAANCDSVVTLALTINNSSTGTDTQIACDSYTWIDGNTYTSSNNTATHTLTNAANCDSVVTLALTINNSTTGTDTQVACDSYTWIDGNTYTSSNNTATHTLTNAANCDSVVTLALTINNSTTGTDTQIACESYTWIDGNTYTASNNTAMFTLTNVANCDSIVTLDLTINNSTTGTDTQTACESYTWIDGNTYTSSNNTATHTLTNAANCDSVVTLALTINNSSTGTDTQIACESYTWIDGNTYTASNNTAMFTLTNVANCDSIVTLDLTINNSTTGTDTQTACESYTWIDGMTYTSSNTAAMFTIVGGAANGCDSIVTLDLTIDDLNFAGNDTSIVICINQSVDLGTLLSSNAQLGGTWLTPAGIPISGTVITSNVANVFDYSYEVSSLACPTSVATISITVDPGCDHLSIIKEAMVDISVYPNPASSVLTILNPSNVSSLRVEMLDMNGRLVLVEDKALNNATKATLAIDRLETGVYTLRVYNSESQRIFKIVKR